MPLSQINNGDSGLSVRTTLNQVIDTYGTGDSSGSFSHAEGNGTQAIGQASHAEGNSTIASGDYSHAEGNGTQAIGNYSHAEGNGTQAIGTLSHAEGYSTLAIGYNSHTEGASTKTGIQNAYYAESVSSGIITLSGSYGDISNQFNADDRLYLYDTPFDQIYFKAIFLISQSYYSNPNTIVELYNTGVTTTTAYVGSITYGIANWFGEQTIPGDYSHTEGSSTIALGDYSHAEGDGTQAIGEYSHAEGSSTQAIGQFSHAEGSSAQAIGDYSHAEGIGAQALGQGSHAEGESIAIGYASHAEGNTALAIGDYSHAEGHSTIASGSYQHVSGQFNTHGDNTSLFIIGNGTADNNRSDVFRVSGSSVQITGSISITNILTLAPQDPLPLGTPTGSFAVSASAPPKPYFWDGSAWNALY